jgi:hypothetical protein
MLKKEESYLRYLPNKFQKQLKTLEPFAQEKKVMVCITKTISSIE